MIDLIKKTLLVGAGAAAVTKEKVEETLGEFVRQGKVTATDARLMADKIVEQGRKEFDEACTRLGGKLKDFTAKSEESTQTRLASLEQRVRVLEEKLAVPATRAGEP
jgi:polyhydroxyalkanoate synthesis regulator phasin